MTDLEALYRAVLASPEEDTPRLASSNCGTSKREPN